MLNESAESLGDEGSKDLKILEALRKPSMATDVIDATGVSKPTVYRRLKTFELNGLIYKAEGIYGCGAAGLAALTSNKMPDLNRPASRIWPWLAELPVPEFRSFVSLALFAIMARRAKVGGDHNPGMVILGPTQRLKSTLIKILCYLAGSTPEACGIQMQSVRARGLIGRLNGKGVLGDTNPTLQEPIVWLEETSLAEPGVYRDVTALLQGSTVLKIESHEVHIPAVPIIEMNPLVDTGDLERRTGMDLPRLRRVILLDATRLEITPIVRRNAKDLLEYFKALGSIRLDDTPQTPLSAGAAVQLDQAITACIRPEAQDYVDTGRLVTLVLGARGLLSDLDAVKEVAWDWAECSDTLGYLVPQWRTRLAGVFLDPTGKATAALADPQIVPVVPSISNEIAQASATQSFNPYLEEDVLRELNGEINKSGLRIPDDTNAIMNFLNAVKILKRNGTNQEQLWTDLVKFSENIQQYKLSLRQVNDALAAHSSHLLPGLPNDTERRFLELWTVLRTAGLTGARASAIATLVSNLISKPVPLPELQDDSCEIMFDGVLYSIMITQVPKHLYRRWLG